MIDVPKKDQVRTYSLDLELLNYESDYTIFITARCRCSGQSRWKSLFNCCNQLPEPIALPDIPDNPGDTKNCGDFADYAEAMAWFDTYYEYYGDVANLDSDDDPKTVDTL